MKTVIFAPQYNGGEITNARKLVSYLKGSDAICSFMDNMILSALLNEKELSIAATLSLALDIYMMYSKAESVVGFLNGKDEAVLVKLGIAYALGVKVLLYKFDPRVSFIAGENSMVLGLGDYKVIKNLKRLERKLSDKVRNEKTPYIYLHPIIKTYITLGEEVYRVYIEEKDRDIHSIIKHFKDDACLLSIINKSFQDRVGQGAKCQLDKVYCSGPLFSPEEQREMLSIEKAFAARQIKAFLPERDGGEPYVLNSMGNLISGALFARPFVNIIHRLLFNIDVMEIIRSRYFIVNLSGRYYDEGAMVEAGIAFALGKPIVLYHNDLRNMFPSGIHPLLRSISCWGEPVKDISKLPEASTRLDKELGASIIDRESLCPTLNNAKKKGERYIKIIKHIKKPKNIMLEWPEGYDE